MYNSSMTGRFASIVLLSMLAAPVCLLSGCERKVGTEPVYEDEGLWVPDTAFTLDEFPFNAAACAGVFPPGSAVNDSVPEDAVADLRIRATACYAATVRVISPVNDTVRTFITRFGIFNRSEEDKNRAEVGFIAWDGKDDQGAKVPPGEYLWRMEFDFGSGRLRKLRASFSVP